MIFHFFFRRVFTAFWASSKPFSLFRMLNSAFLMHLSKTPPGSFPNHDFALQATSFPCKMKSL